MLDSRPMQPSVSMETPAGVRCWNRPDASARSHTSTLPALRKSSHVDGGAALGVMWRRASAIPRERFSPRGVIGRVAPEAPFSPSEAPGSPRSHDRIHAFAGIELACASATTGSCAPAIPGERFATVPIVAPTAWPVTPRRSRNCGLLTADGSVRPRVGRDSCAGRTAGRMSPKREKSLLAGSLRMLAAEPGVDPARVPEAARASIRRHRRRDGDRLDGVGDQPSPSR
jgi:hypothetical protein